MNSVETNRAYYESESTARRDYWRYMAAPRQRVSRICREVARIAPASLVDLGCGDGSLLAEIALRSPKTNLAGIDLSKSQIARNRVTLPAVAWLDSDLTVPIALGERFEAVVASEVIEHLPEPRMLLDNAARLALPAAHLVLTTQSGRVGETERRVGHVRHFTAGEMRSLLGECVWTPLRVWNEGLPFHDLSKWWANRDPDASMAQFGSERPYGSVERAISFALRAAFRLNSRSRGAQLYAVAVKTP
jgi:2-polyprenyl-3-methyl-5-hydroxy-6-metoxy-1,4-benzoquinol methylase